MQQQKQQLAAAKAAQGAERQKLMAEHMQMMQETMGKMQSMKPKADMSPKDKDEWITEHLKLMEQMMGQMMEEHHLMTQSTAVTTNKPAKSAKQKPVKSHDPAAGEVTGRSTHPDASGGSEVKSHDPAASEVVGRSTHPDASGGSEIQSHKEGQGHDRGGATN
jgi:hypothetical protein